MAIVIPSKHIYGSPQVAKVRDNVIERVEINTVKVFPTYSENEKVYGTTIDNAENKKYKYNTTIDKDLKAATYGSEQGSVGLREYCVAYIKIDEKQAVDVEIYIPVVFDNKYIENISTGTDSDNLPKIGCRVVGKKIIGQATANWSCSVNSNSNTITVTEGTISYESSTETTLGEEISFLEEYSFTMPALSYPIDQTAMVTLTKWGNQSTARAEKVTIDSKEYYKISLTLMAGYRKTALGYSDELSTVDDGFTILSKVPLVGGYETYIPQTLEISFNGRTTGIDFKEETLYINGLTSKKVFAVDSNELMQTTNYRDNVVEWEMQENIDYKETVNSGGVSPLSLEPMAGIGGGNTTTIAFLTENAINAKKTINYMLSGVKYSITLNAGVESYTISGLAIITSITAVLESRVNTIIEMYSKTQNEYKNGKETITLRCSISEYYNEQDKLTISAKDTAFPMCFNLYDEVMPMVLGLNGKEKPMSVSQDGTPKKFKVLSVRPFYDGAVWQELLLQEI